MQNRNQQPPDRKPDPLFPLNRKSLIIIAAAVVIFLLLLFIPVGDRSLFEVLFPAPSNHSDYADYRGEMPRDPATDGDHRPQHRPDDSGKPSNPDNPAARDTDDREAYQPYDDNVTRQVDRLMDYDITDRPFRGAEHYDYRGELRVKAKDFATFEPVIIERVVDADTVMVVPDYDTPFDGERIIQGRERLRLLAINAPESYSNPQVERQTAIGQAASDYAEHWLTGRRVFLEFDIEIFDQYDRHLAYLWLDDDYMVNEAIVRMGWAKVVRFGQNTRYYNVFKDIEREAKREHLGMWGTHEN